VKNPNHFFTNLAKSPILWGGLASAGFYILMEIVIQFQQKLGVERAGKTLATVISIHRDFLAGHPIEYTTTTLFFIGLAILVMRAIDLARHRLPRSHSQLVLGPVVPGGQPFDAVNSMLSRLDSVGGRCHPLLTARLRDVLERVRRRGSAEGVEDELKYLADRDADGLHESYALFRVVIWAIPILGFLGTVVGIIMAIANLSPSAIEESMPATIAALSVAFATTAQSLSMSMVLMFGKYQIGQVENRLMAEVDRRADEEMLGRFEQVASGAEGQLTAVRRMSETMIDAAEHLVARQTELWQKSIDAADKRWVALTREAEAQLGKAMAVSLHEGLKSHAAVLTASEKEMAGRNQKHWQQVQETLVRSVEAAAALHGQLTQQTDVLRRTVEATGQVAKLEETLNRNLSALAGEKHFEQTVMSLAAAIHLLNARLEEVPGERVDVELQPKRVSGQAA